MFAFSSKDRFRFRDLVYLLPPTIKALATDPYKIYFYDFEQKQKRRRKQQIPHMWVLVRKQEIEMNTNITQALQR